MIIEKEHKRSALMSLSKAVLVDNIMRLEHNSNVLHDTIDTQYKNIIEMTRWIPVEERSPDEPNALDEKGHIDWDKAVEYNVTIDGASKATSLYYLGGDQWTDIEGEPYQVIAWMPLPAAYKPEN